MISSSTSMALASANPTLTKQDKALLLGDAKLCTPVAMSR